MKRNKKPQWRYNFFELRDAFCQMKGSYSLHIKFISYDLFEWTVTCPYNGINIKGTATNREAGQRAALRAYRKKYSSCLE